MGDHGKFQNYLKYVFAWKCTIKGIKIVIVSTHYSPERYGRSNRPNWVDHENKYMLLLRKIFPQKKFKSFILPLRTWTLTTMAQFPTIN